MTRKGARRRRGEHDSPGHSGGSERWLVSYADLITLLFAFFVVLYAISQADMKKFREISESMRRAFAAKSGTERALKPTEANPSGAPSSQHLSGGLLPASNQAIDRADPELDQIRRLLEEVAEFDSSVSKVEQTPVGEIRWVILDSYPERTTKVAEDYWPLLRRVARVLARFPERPIRWEGHADADEAGDNSRVAAIASLDRAVWVDQFMRQEWKMIGGSALRRRPAEIAGFAASRPLRFEATRWARARNRRVELVILNR